MVEEETETLDVTKLTWRRPLHRPETNSPIRIVPWKALCGAILYDRLHKEPGDNICERCEQLCWEMLRGNS
jgi:hypothetical protein